MQTPADVVWKTIYDALYLSLTSAKSWQAKTNSIQNS